MSAFVDTNVLVRHLTGDPPDQASRATELLRSGEELILVDLVLAELIYVLESVYERPRGEVASLTRSVLAFPPVAVLDHDLLLRSLELYELERLDFAEAYLVASAELSGIRRIASFDRSLDRVRTIQRIEA